jgi:transcriptional regulator with XRE-family HTH domain
MPVGIRIRELRIKRGLTQSELADGIVTPSMISLIESDRANPSEKVLRAIAEKLGVSLEELAVEESSDWEDQSVILIAHTLLLSNQVEAAETMLRSRIPESDRFGRFNDVLLAECRLRQGDYTGALRLLEGLEEKWQSDTTILLSIWTKMGRLYAEQGNTEVADHYWQKAYQICKGESSVRFADTFECIVQMVKFYLEERRYDDMLRIINDCEQKWKFPSTLEELAQIYLESSLTAQGEKKFQISTTMAHRASTLLRSVELLRGAANLQLYKEIVSPTETPLEPSLYSSADHQILAKLYLQKGNLDLAMGYATEALKSPRSLRQKALTLQVLSEIQEAKGMYMLAAETIKEMIDIWEELANSEQIAKCYTRLTQVLGKASASN